MVPPCLELDMGSFDKRENKHWKLNFIQSYFLCLNLGPLGGTPSTSLCEDQSCIFNIFFHGTNTIIIKVADT